MPIELTCDGCGRQLRVPDEHAGKQARCPVCGKILPIPLAGSLGGQPTGSPFGGAFANNSPPAGQPQNPFSENAAPASPFAANNSYAPPTQSLMPQYRGPPHRGGVVLTLGILGLCCCVLLGIAAWIMGHEDLKAMREGRMDPSGHSLTQVGMVLGIVSTVLNGLGLIMQVLVHLGGK
jgi:hypothetical protein